MYPAHPRFMGACSSEQSDRAHNTDREVGGVANRPCPLLRRKVKRMPADALTIADVKQEMIDNRLDGVSRKVVNDVVKALVEEVHDCLANGYKVTIPGLGTYEPVLKAGRKKGTVVRNPFNGTEKTLRSDEPDKFVVKVKKPQGIANRVGFPSLKSKNGQELAKRLKPKAKAKTAAPKAKTKSKSKSKAKGKK